ncbi:hypothetical protein [Nocardia sp. bgisy134]
MRQAISRFHAIDRLEHATAVDLGFPHEFLSRPLTRSVTFGDLKIEQRA